MVPLIRTQSEQQEGHKNNTERYLSGRFWNNRHPSPPVAGRICTETDDGAAIIGDVGRLLEDPTGEIESHALKSVLKTLHPLRRRPHECFVMELCWRGRNAP